MRCALLHGFAGDPASWDDVIAAWPLPDAARVIPLPGHGGGPVQPTWDQNLDVIATAIGDADVVVGYSLGARIALGLVATGRCSRGVLIGVNPGIGDSERGDRRASDARWASVLRDQGIVAFEAAWTAQPLFASQSRVDPDRLAARRARRLALDPEQLAQSLERMGPAAMPDYRSHVAGHASHLALIAGADDTRYVSLARSLAAASFETVPDAGHDPTLEQPERLAAAIARAVVRLA